MQLWPCSDFLYRCQDEDCVSDVSMPFGCITYGVGMSNAFQVKTRKCHRIAQTKADVCAHVKHGRPKRIYRYADSRVSHSRSWMHQGGAAAAAGIETMAENAAKVMSDYPASSKKNA